MTNEPEIRPRGLLRRLMAYAATAVAPSVESVSQTVVEGAKDMGKAALDITIFVLIGLVGYVFVMLGLALVLGPQFGAGPTLLVIGGIHLVIGVLGVIVLVRRKRTRAAAEDTTPALEAVSPPAVS
jgi:hypothetical protein